MKKYVLIALALCMLSLGACGKKNADNQTEHTETTSEESTVSANAENSEDGETGADDGSAVDETEIEYATDDSVVSEVMPTEAFADATDVDQAAVDRLLYEKFHGEPAHKEENLYVYSFPITNKATMHGKTYYIGTWQVTTYQDMTYDEQETLDVLKFALSDDLQEMYEVTVDEDTGEYTFYGERNLIAEF